MPIYHKEIAQYSVEWDALHLGIPTASAFKKIITPLGKPSRQWQDYAYHLLAERFLGRPVDTYTSPWMERGNMLEDDACNFYQMHTGREIEKIGFITTDDGLVGCSPDRLVGEEGLVEIKVPAPQTQMKYLITGELDDDYRPQTQGQLYVSGRQWVDVISYHPELPPRIIRVERDPLFIACLEGQLRELNNYLGEVTKKIALVANVHNRPEVARYLQINP